MFLVRTVCNRSCYGRFSRLQLSTWFADCSHCRAVSTRARLIRSCRSSSHKNGLVQVSLLRLGRRHHGLQVYSAAGLSWFSGSSKEVQKEDYTTDVSSFPEHHDFLEDDIGFIPEPPTLPAANDTILYDYAPQFVEGSLKALGLGSHYTPTGWAQIGFDWLHSTTGLPWVSAIALATLCIRLIILPLAIGQRKNVVRIQNGQSQLEPLTQELRKAQRGNDKFKVRMIMMDIEMTSKELGVNYPRFGLYAAAQGLTFLTSFTALRGLSYGPVAGMSTEGALWFPDLTIPDPFLILPIAASLSLLAMIEIGADFGAKSSQQMVIMKYVFRALPFGIFLAIKGFPAAIVLYWALSNFFALLTVAILNIKDVRQYFGIPEVVKKPAGEKKGLRESIREGMATAQAKSIGNRKPESWRARLKKAAEAPAPQTFDKNPMKPKDSRR